MIFVHILKQIYETFLNVLKQLVVLHLVYGMLLFHSGFTLCAHFVNLFLVYTNRYAHHLYPFPIVTQVVTFSKFKAVQNS